MKEIEIYSIRHCDHESCDLGKLQVEECPQCGEEFDTTDNFYIYDDYRRSGRGMKFTCPLCCADFSVLEQKGKWYLI